MAGPNALHPDWMTAEERLKEVARLLAAGFLRLQARSARDPATFHPVEQSRVELDFSPAESGAARPLPVRREDHQ